MHGVAKVSLDESQKKIEESKRKKKINFYLTTRDKIFAKINDSVFDLDGLQFTADLLVKNPDVYTFWNYRKKALLRLKDLQPHLHATNVPEQSNDDKKINFSNLCRGELELTETCLQKNPKSYGAWHHRFWVVENCMTRDSVNVDSEIKRCDALLMLDGRNFHCWDYWRLVCNFADYKLSDQLEYTKAKIDYNFSNYSAWHCRATLLPQILNARISESGKGRIDSETFKNESKLILEGMFTDVKDQSAFFYKIWLLSQVCYEDINLSIIEIYLHMDTPLFPELTITFNRHVTLTADSVTFVLNDFTSTSQPKFDWKAADGSRCFKTWKCKDSNLVTIANSDVFTVSFADSSHNCRIAMERSTTTNSVTTYLPTKTSDHIIDSNTISEVSSMKDYLKGELSLLSELVTTDPNEKWPLLIYILVLKQLDVRAYKEEIFDGLQRLKKLDPLRVHYYEYLLKQWNIKSFQ